jgi:hypothetical protein
VAWLKSAGLTQACDGGGVYEIGGAPYENAEKPDSTRKKRYYGANSPNMVIAARRSPKMERADV